MQYHLSRVSGVWISILNVFFQILFEFFYFNLVGPWCWPVATTPKLPWNLIIPIDDQQLSTQWIRIFQSAFIQRTIVGCIELALEYFEENFIESSIIASGKIIEMLAIEYDEFIWMGVHKLPYLLQGFGYLFTIQSMDEVKIEVFCMHTNP